MSAPKGKRTSKNHSISPEKSLEQQSKPVPRLDVGSSLNGTTNGLEASLPGLDELPPETKDMVVEIITSRFFAGPLPPPQTFEEYDKVLPGAAERILALTEGQNSHRHGMEMGSLKIKSNGQWLAFFVVLILLIAVSFCVWQDALWIAGILASTLVAIAAIFVTGKIKKN